MMSWLYNLAFTVFGILYLPVFLMKIKQAEDPGRLWRERLGRLPESWRAELKGKRIVWLHAVSVGEVRAVEKFVQEWLAQTSDLDLVLTTVTPTGQRIAKKLEGPRVHVSYFPFDLTFAVRRFFDLLSPVAVLLAETEIWPNLLTEAKRRAIPVGVVNARLSERSFKRYKAFSFLLGGLWKKVDFVLAQTEDDAGRFRGLGVPPEAVREMGNMKFDLTETAASDEGTAVKMRKEFGLNARDLVFIAGSTHPGEEEVLLKVFKELKEKFAALRMIIAPRHIERSERILGEAGLSGLKAALSTQRDPAGAWEVLILNELGVLRNLYQIADLVFVGGSFVPHGGQNPIEPAHVERAALHGKHVFNFNKIYRELDQGGGAFEVKDPGDLKVLSEKFLSDPALRREAGVKARGIVNRLRGASKRQAGWALTFVRSRCPKERIEGDGRSQESFSVVGGGKVQ
jgi:3-deoxy-D-manno-octulosonic-acid transferase